MTVSTIPRGPTKGPLSSVAFRWFFSARVVSLVGSNAAPVALAFAVLEYSHNEADLGFVLAARSVMLVVCVLWGGVVADRYPREKVVMAGYVGSCVTQASAALLLVSGNFTLWAIMAIEAVNGLLTALTIPGNFGLINQVAPQGQFQKATALLGSSRQVATILGPSVGGLLVVSVGGGWALLLDAACYAVAAVCLAQLHLPAVVQERAPGMIAQWKEGFAEFRHHSWIWTICLGFSVLIFVESGVMGVLGPVIADHSYGEQGWGLVLGAQACGFFVSTIIFYRVHVSRFMLCGQICLTLTPLALIPMACEWGLGWTILGFFVSGAAFSVFGIAWDTSMQEHVAPEKLSRVTSFDAFGSWVMMPLGEMTVLPLAHAVGFTEYLWWGGVLWFLMAAWPLLIPQVRHLSHARQNHQTQDDSTRQP